MNPAPMSDSEIQAQKDRQTELRAKLNAALAKAHIDGYYETMWALVSVEVDLALAARDAQWQQMIGEPVAWRLSGNGHEQPTGPQFWRRPPNSLEVTSWARLGIPADVTPLYAIKETP